MTGKQFLRLSKQAITAWSDDYAPSMGAALSYYTLFSITPLLVILIAIAGFFFGADAVRHQILAQLAGLMGEEGAGTVDALLRAANRPDEGGIAALISIFVLVIGATTVINELQSDLDRIWHAPAAHTGSGARAFLRARFVSVVVILTIAFVLMVSLVFSAAVAAVAKWWGDAAGRWQFVARALDLGLSFAVMTLLFALIYKIVPRVRIAWRDVWVGAAVTSLLFAVGKVLIGIYLGRSGISTGFGAAGSLVLVMVWVYYSAQIFLVGAEFTWVYAHERGSRRTDSRSGARKQRTGHEKSAERT